MTYRRDGIVAEHVPKLVNLDASDYSLTVFLKNEETKAVKRHVVFECWLMTMFFSIFTEKTGVSLWSLVVGSDNNDMHYVARGLLWLLYLAAFIFFGHASAYLVIARVLNKHRLEYLS